MAGDEVNRGGSCKAGREGFMHRPLVYVSIFFASGILVTQYYSLAATHSLGLWGLVAFLTTLSLVLRPSAHFRRLTHLSFLIFLVVSGFFYAGLREEMGRGTLAPYLSRDKVTLLGTVVAEPEVQDGKTRYVLSVRAVIGTRPGERRKEESRGRVLVVDYSGRPTPYQYGDSLQVTGRLAIPPSSRNPGGFDYRAYLAHRGIYYRISAWRQEQITRTGRGSVNPVNGAALRFRKLVLTLMDRYLEAPRAELLSGLLLGDHSRLPETLKSDFTDAGVNHVLAVSGLHVGFISIGFWWFLRKLGCPPRVTAVVGMVVIAFFILVTGSRPSVIRAGIMAMVAFLALLVQREKDPLNLLGLAAFLCLVYNPFSLFDLGFQLSFLATLGILTGAPLLEKHLAGLPRWLRTSLAVSLSAQVAVAPVLTWNFNRLSLIAPVANLIVVPLVGLVISGGLIFVFALMTFPPVGVLAAKLIGLPLDLLVLSVRIFAGVPFASVDIGTPDRGFIAAYYLFCSQVFGLWPGSGGRAEVFPLMDPVFGPGLQNMSWAGRDETRDATLGLKARPGPVFPGVLLILVAALVWVWSGIVGDPPGTMTVTFLDVGQGDAAFLEFPGGVTMLIDGGGRENLGVDGRRDGSDGGNGGYDAGRMVVVPFLRHKGVHRIDYVLMSHPHEDHIGGLVAVLEGFKVGFVLGPGLGMDVGVDRVGEVGVDLGVGQKKPTSLDEDDGVAPSLLDLVEACRTKGIPLSELHQGQVLKFPRGIEVKVLHPGRPRLQGTGSDTNNNSLVVRVSYGRYSFLFTGDLQAEGENQILRTLPAEDLRSTVLKVPHHGSNLGTGRAFLEVVRPRYAVISVGSNPYGLPHRSVVERLNEQGIEVMRTDRDGAVVFKTNGTRLWVLGQEPAHR